MSDLLGCLGTCSLLFNLLFSLVGMSVLKQHVVCLHLPVFMQMVSHVYQQMQLVCRSSLSVGHTALTAAQKEEEDVLQKAVQERRDQFGPPANLYSEPVTQAFNFRPRQSQQSASQQPSQPSPLSLQPRNYVKPPQTDTGMHQAMYRQQGSQRRGQAEEQGASSSTQNLHQGRVSFQPQNTAPAGFVQFGVEPKGPAE